MVHDSSVETAPLIAHAVSHRDFRIDRSPRPVNVLINNAALGSKTVEAYSDSRHSADCTAETTGDSSCDEIRMPPLLSGVLIALTLRCKRTLVFYCAAADMSAQQDVDLMTVNALGPMWITEALRPAMTQQVCICLMSNFDMSSCMV